VRTDTRERLLSYVKQIALELSEDLLLAPGVVGRVYIWLINRDGFEVCLALNVLKLALERESWFHLDILVG